MPTQTTSSAPRTGYIPTLDGWRAVAILLVLFSHAAHGWAQHAASGGWFGRVATATHGVNIFFGLSGLLITTRLLEEWRHDGSISLRRFYVRRAFRILPAAMLCLACIGALGVLGLLPVIDREFLAAVFFYRNYLPPVLGAHGAGYFTAHYWSLAVEEHFYLLWPALLLLAGGRRALWIAVAIAIGVAGWRRVELWREIANYHRVLPVYFVRTDTRLDSLMWGAVAALVLARPGARAWLAARFNQSVWLAIAVLYLAIIARYGTRPTLFEAAIVPALLVGTVLAPSGAVGRLLEHPAMRWIGRLSYSLYLWELFFVYYPGVEHTLGVLQTFPVNLVAAVGCAAASYYFVERPLIRMGHRLAPSVTPGSVDTIARSTPPLGAASTATAGG